MHEQDPELWARRSSSFGAVAEAYADHRPDYAAEAIAWALAGCAHPALQVLDLAAGTGALTAGLLVAGVDVLAVEPDPGMAAELRRRLPGVEVVSGRAEAIPVPDASVDVVVVGTAFHWFDPDVAGPEIARVLRPGGVLALLYNIDDQSVPWVDGLGAISMTSASTPRNAATSWPDCPGFGPFEERRFEHRQRRTADSLTETVGTHSHTHVVSAEERAEVLGRVRAYLGEQPETAIGTFDMPLLTVVARAAVADPASLPGSGPEAVGHTGVPMTAQEHESETVTEQQWGRVDDDGTVFVRTADGERSVGQYPGDAEEAMRFFTERYDALAFEVELLERRIRSGVMSPEEATESIRTVSVQVGEANAVGDLQSLVGRLAGLGPVVASQRQAKREERAQKADEAKAAKEKLVQESEKLAESSDWRAGANRMRDLLEEWKALPRIDRPSDDALWKRFSAARTTYTRRRKTHFAEQSEKRESAKVVKERLVKEAEALSGSTEWGPTSGKYRDLMTAWKSAGPAPKDVEDELWTRFRSAQDTFFQARDASNAAQDSEFAANAEVKLAILVEAEALLPIKDLDAAKRTFRGLADRWDAAGKVPRDQIKDLDARIRKVEQAIRSLDEDKWKRTDPEKSARADDMVSKLETAIAGVRADLEKARAAGDAKKIAELEDNLASRESFLEMARRVSTEYKG